MSVAAMILDSESSVFNLSSILGRLYGTIVFVEINLSTLIVTVMREIAISSKTTTGFEFSHVIRADIIEGCFLRWMFLKLILVAYNASL